MREPIRFERITTQAQWDELKEFAKEDGHRMDDHSIDPIVNIWRGNKRIGWLHLLTQPVIMPCFSVKNCSPRDFKEVCETATEYYKRTSVSHRFPEGTCFIAIPLAPAIDENIIEKLGFKRIQREVWQNL